MNLSAESFGLLADAIGIIGAIFAFLAWLKLQLEESRRNKKITVKLQAPDEVIELPVDIRRAELTRSEILGRIGMLNSGKRFNLRYLNDPEFFRRLNEIIEGSGETVLTIVCTKDELQQFKSNADDSESNSK